MRLTVNLVTGGKYVRAGDELPSDFVLPSHLDRFVIYDDETPQTSRADLRFSSDVEGHPEGFRTAGTQPAKPATYPEGEEEFAPQWEKKKERKRRL